MAQRDLMALKPLVEAAAEASDLGVPSSRPLSLTELAYRAIRQAIRDGVLVPRQTYSEAAIGEALGMSRTPVREALIEFQRDGLIEIQPQRGFRLKELTAKDGEEAFRLRSAIETVVVETLARTRTESDVIQLQQILDRQRAAVRDPSRFMDLDEAFHLTMTRLVDMERAFRFLFSLRGILWMLGTSALNFPQRFENVIKEHQVILNAVKTGDADAAVRAIQAHIAKTEAAIDWQKSHSKPQQDTKPRPRRRATR